MPDITAVSSVLSSINAATEIVKLVRLQGYGKGYWDCKTCKNIYTDSNYQMDRIDYPDSGVV